MTTFSLIQMAFFALISVFLALITVARTDSGINPGSTLNLRDIVIGRCDDYLRKNEKLRPKDCTAIWEKFRDVFAFKDVCQLTPSDYQPFFDAVEEGVINNKAMFWSGTYKAAHSYSFFDLTFTTLEDTFAGSMMNDLRWCGNPSLPPNTTDGIDYKSCPSCFKYNKFFWIQASITFAERVRGQARVMVNGTRISQPAYSNKSIFGKYELPNLKVADITKLFVIVLHTIGKKPIEKCGTKSIKKLEADATALGLNVHCENDPDMARHVLCIDHPKANECRFHDENQEPVETYWKILGIIFVVLFSVLLIVLIVLVALYFCRKKGSSTRAHLLQPNA
ncbi:ADP-ribosyl cyclase/cyclic ADP-ribose hydrolase-like [Actinia tenebrosa]|uniref:ADP-ribosyl cyclase/cyclic ADP-ribose hydrolase-like n=1 Tax=Actinia tenebrosa TaxID=6105 RepID=A0A6P8IM00_ACTTE|nr:ADP-ribosyl cyclase/cyclic ADP-ribose hydrolase-like [Actinia tenebrosa]